MLRFPRALQKSSICSVCLLGGSLIFASAALAHGAGGGGMAGFHGGGGGTMAAGQFGSPGGFGTMPHSNRPVLGQSGSGFAPEPHHAPPQQMTVDPPGAPSAGGDSASGILMQPHPNTPIKGQPGDRPTVEPHPDGN